MGKARFTHGQMARLLGFLRDKRITHLGFSLMTGNFRAFQEIVQYLRREGWKGCIIAGGVHPTIRPEESLCEGVDYVVMGPGELPLRDILRDRAPEEVSGLVYRRDGGIVRNPILDHAYLELETLPFPDYDFEDHVLIRDQVTLQFDAALYQELSPWAGTYDYLTTGRGCPYRCAYCCNINRHHLMRASVGRAIEELHWAKKKMPSCADAIPRATTRSLWALTSGCKNSVPDSRPSSVGHSSRRLCRDSVRANGF